MMIHALSLPMMGGKGDGSLQHGDVLICHGHGRGKKDR
jgi:hypothetical protein